MIYVHVWDINICFEIAMTIVKTYTPKNQIPGYAPVSYRKQTARRRLRRKKKLVRDGGVVEPVKKKFHPVV